VDRPFYRLLRMTDWYPALGGDRRTSESRQAHQRGGRWLNLTIADMEFYPPVLRIPCFEVIFGLWSTESPPDRLEPLRRRSYGEIVTNCSAPFSLSSSLYPKLCRGAWQRLWWRFLVPGRRGRCASPRVASVVAPLRSRLLRAGVLSEESGQFTTKFTE
jgi:hypothetical protein